MNDKIQNNKPLMWSEQIGNEIYVYWRGSLIYKRWGIKKKQPSLLLNDNGWPNEWIN